MTRSNQFNKLTGFSQSDVSLITSRYYALKGGWETCCSAFRNTQLGNKGRRVIVKFRKTVLRDQNFSVHFKGGITSMFPCSKNNPFPPFDD